MGCQGSIWSQPVTEDAQSESRTEASCSRLVGIGSYIMGMTKTTTHLFVYGTLMPRESNHQQIQECVHAVRPGTIEGILVSLGAFPALIPGGGTVRGVVLDVDQAALEIADRIEGCSPDPCHCLYTRKEVIVRFNEGGELRAWTYEFANPSSIADKIPLVVGHSKGKPIFAWSERLNDGSSASA